MYFVLTLIYTVYTKQKHLNHQCPSPAIAAVAIYQSPSIFQHTSQLPTLVLNIVIHKNVFSWLLFVVSCCRLSSWWFQPI